MKAAIKEIATKEAAAKAAEAAAETVATAIVAPSEDMEVIPLQNVTPQTVAIILKFVVLIIIIVINHLVPITPNAVLTHNQPNPMFQNRATSHLLPRTAKSVLRINTSLTSTCHSSHPWNYTYKMIPKVSSSILT